MLGTTIIVLAAALAGPAPAPGSPAPGSPPAGPIAADNASSVGVLPPSTGDDDAEETEPTSEAHPASSSSESDASAPAALPGASPASPGTSTAAVGTGGQTPLPPAPAGVDPASLRETPWRGRFSLAFDLGVIGSVGGRRPGRGTVVSAYGGFGFAARVHRLVTVGAAFHTFLHDTETATVTDPATGEAAAERGFGRVTLVDLALVRVAWPLANRIEPYAQAGGGLGLRREGVTGEAAFAGTVRAGIGTDFWLGPTFALGLDFGYRTILVQKTAGHALMGGARFAIHW